MIPQHEEVTIYSKPNESEKAYTINASPEAFKILSSGIYSNKIKAIVRELSCNAYDSHVMARKQNEPFQIHLPDVWEPYFSVEDFGVGLDDVEIENIYTSYFTSTKTGSNDTIGGLGLGSKTPFSYTDTYTVRSRKDGVERVYNAFIGASGMPTVNMISEVDTDEGNGVLVTVPVKEKDFYNFRNEATLVFKYFTTVPTFVGQTPITVNNGIVNQLDEHGFLVHSQYRAKNVVVVMGNVAYDVAAEESLIPKTEKRIWSILETNGIIIRFGIGELSVAASRETISFDEPTKNAFLNKLINLSSAYYWEYQNAVDKLDNILDKLNYAHSELMGDFGLNLLEYDGTPLIDFKEYEISNDLYKIVVGDVKGANAIVYRKNGYKYNKTILEDYTIKNENCFRATETINFVMDDTDHHRNLENMCKSVARDYDAKYTVMVNRVLSDNEQQAIVDLFGDKRVGEFFTLSQLREEARLKRVSERKARETNRVYVPVVRAKKDEVRVSMWTNNYSNCVHKYYSNDLLKEAQIVDVSNFENKRVMIIPVSRGIMQIESVLNNSSSIYMTVSNSIMLSKVFGYDYIIYSNPKKIDALVKRIPNVMVAPEKLTTNDIKDYDVALFYYLIKKSSTLGYVKDVKRMFVNADEGSLDVNEYLMNQLSLDFNADSDIEYATLLKIGCDVPEAKTIMSDLVKKFKENLAKFNDFEILSEACCGRDEISSVYSSSPIYPFWEKYKALLKLRFSKKVEDQFVKYPMLNLIEIDEDDEKSIKILRDYVELINIVDDKIDNMTPCKLAA